MRISPTELEINVFGVIILMMMDASVWIYSCLQRAKQVPNKSVSSIGPGL